MVPVHTNRMDGIVFSILSSTRFMMKDGCHRPSLKPKVRRGSTVSACDLYRDDSAGFEEC
jgi:hypothetical protein